MVSPEWKFSTLVVGSGPAGSHLSKLLATRGVDVLVLDMPNRTKPFLETLSSRAIPLVGGNLDTSKPCTSNCSLWGGWDVIERAGILRPTGHDWFINRSKFDNELLNKAIAAGATCWHTKATSVKREMGCWNIEMRDGRKIKTKFLVDATGKASAIGIRLGSKRVRIDSLVGIPFQLKCLNKNFEYSTLVAASPGGWWYMGPASDCGNCAVFFTDLDLPEYRYIRSKHGAQQMLFESGLVDQFVLGASGKPFPAFSELLQPCAGEGWLAIGDAAASFDPLSSQGLYKALNSAQLADTVIAGNTVEHLYQSNLQNEFIEFLTDRVSVYGREKRWLSNEFWLRRSIPPELFSTHST